MTEQEKILEELKKNLGEERLDEIMDSVRSFFSGPGRGARPASKSTTQTSSPAPTSKPPAEINPTAAARANIGDNSLGGGDTPPAMQKIQAARPTAPAPASAPVPSAASVAAPAQRTGSIRAGLSRAGLGTDQSGVVGGATPADRARPATAAPETSSFAPANVAKQQQANRAAADDRDAADMASQASNRAAPAAKPSEPSTLSNTARMAPSMTMGAGGGLSPVGSSVGKPSEPAAKAPAAQAQRSAAPSAPSAPAQPSRSSQMFQAASDKGDDATSADFFRADKQAQAERKITPAASQKPQQSNTDYMKSSGMMDEANLERKIRKMFEQKSAKFTGGGADIQDLSGPNKPVGKSEKEQHHGTFEEESIQEIVGTATSFGGRHARRRRSQAKTTLGGEGLQQRSSMIRSGNQKAAGRYEEYTISEARKASFKKVEKMKRNRTDTGSFADPIDTEPSKPSMTGY